MSPPADMARRGVKRLGALGWRRLSASRCAPRAIGLCYHSIHPTKSYASVTPLMFERHLEWLSAACDVVPFRALPETARQAGHQRPKVAITFDDGYADNFEYAFPLLQKYSMPATVFITAGFIARDPGVLARFTTLRGTSVAETRPLQWSQVREMLTQNIEVGAHTYSHPNLAFLDRAQTRRELGVSREILEDGLQIPIAMMAYPFGKPKRHFSRQTVESVREIGYTQAAAILSRAVRYCDSSYALPRFFATGDTVADLARKVRGDFDYIGIWQEHAPLLIARVVSPGDFRL